MLDLSIDSEEDLNNTKNLKNYRAGLDMLSDLILHSDDGLESKTLMKKSII